MRKNKKFITKFSSNYKALRTGGRKADSTYYRSRIAHKKIAYIHFLVENIDQIVIVASMKKPRLRSGLIDRFLTLAQWSNLQAVIILTKRDLVPLAELTKVQDIYKKLSCKVYSLANPPQEDSLEEDSSGEDIGEGQSLSFQRGDKPFVRLREEVFAGKKSALVGHSGVGKTALLRRLDPTYTGRVGEISAFTQRGRHTTTRVTSHLLSFSGEVFDMPGLKELDFTDVTQADLRQCYEEFLIYAGDCSFKNCLHLEEPDCAVRAAVEAKKIHPVRYRNYLRILSTLDKY